MKRRKLFALLLAVVMTLGTAPVFAADAFTDVAADAYYAEAVKWAVEKEITNGKGGGRFAPEDTVTRAEAVTFLWRMAGKPEPAQTQTFTDVESDPNNGWYKTAVQWAVEKGITNGTGSGMFSPAVTCARGMILTMLYRMEDSPFDAAMAAEIPDDMSALTLDDLGNALVQALIEALRSEDGLTDVKEGDYFELPIAWALMNSILSEDMIDMEAMAVHPNDPCPRGEMVYFLYGASKYEAASAAAAEANEPAEPVETGIVPKTVVMDKEGVKVTLTGIGNDDYGDPLLNLTVENGTGKLIGVDASELFVNTYSVSPSTYVPTEGQYGFTYEDAIVPAGESRDFHVGTNYLREKGIAAVYEIELKMSAYTVEKIEDGYEYDYFAFGEPVTVKTSLYDKSVSYDQEGTAVYDKDGLKVVVCKAENNEYAGPQIAVYAYNSGSKEVSLELAEIKLDGKAVEAFFGMDIPAGKRCVESISLDIDYDNIPTVKEAEITLRTMDLDTWEPLVTFDPVKVTFAD